MTYKLILGATELDITLYISELSGGLSQYPITAYNRIGNGAILSKNNTFSNKVYEMTASFTSVRATFRETFLKWMSYARNKEIYLEKTDDTGYTGRIRIYPVIKSGEEYSKMLKKYTSEYQLISEESFYSSTSLTTVNDTIPDTITVTNSGLIVYATYTFTITTAANYIKLYLAEGYGFEINTTMSISDVIVVSTSSNRITVTKNGGELLNVLSALSTPFVLEAGENEITVESDGAASISITYNETRL